MVEKSKDKDKQAEAVAPILEETPVVEQSKKFSVYVRLTAITPSHIHFDIFAAFINADIPHERATRANLGNTLKLRNEEFVPFVERLQPDLVAFKGREFIEIADLVGFIQEKLSV